MKTRKTTKTVNAMAATEAKAGVIPPRIIKLEDIPGAEYQKRALEVALTGEHPIVLLYSNGSKAVDLINIARRIAQENGWAFHGLAYPTCPCGNYCHIIRECDCNVPAIKGHLSKLGKRVAEFDIWTEAPADRPNRQSAQWGELEADFIARVAKAKASPAPSADIDASCREFITMFIQNLSDCLDIPKVTRIAQSIARLDGRDRILMQHVAEALQYQPYAVSGFRAFIEPQPVEAEV